ncbi:murein hydrolase activator EnvC family protein [Georgenia sp. Z1491]|uniref:murein hydrolase activator EnvC family protein n=1 Tax=Georgenia sp. Z1491 TaxID=3416707 RepID=UPI003CEBD931
MTAHRPPRPGRDDARRAVLVLALALCLSLLGARAPTASGTLGTEPFPDVGPAAGRSLPLGPSLALEVAARYAASDDTGAPGRAGAVGSAGAFGGGAAVGSAGAGSAPSSEASSSLVNYDWPTGGPVRVVAPFEGSATPYGPGHRGVDLDVRPGTVILAAADGIVAFRGSVADRPVISIDHADGIRTTYEPVSSSLSTGDAVAGGDPIGTLTAGHCPPPGCLHWGARHGSHDYVDPMSLIGDAPQPVRLLPFGG